MMILDIALWPVVALAGGAIYLDAAGREAAKFLSLRKEGLRLGTAKQQRVFFASYIVMALIGLSATVYSVTMLVTSI